MTNISGVVEPELFPHNLRKRPRTEIDASGIYSNDAHFVDTGDSFTPATNIFSSPEHFSYLYPPTDLKDTFQSPKRICPPREGQDLLEMYLFLSTICVGGDGGYQQIPDNAEVQTQPETPGCISRMVSLISPGTVGHKDHDQYHPLSPSNTVVESPYTSEKMAAGPSSTADSLSYMFSPLAPTSPQDPTLGVDPRHYDDPGFQGSALIPVACTLGEMPMITTPYSVELPETMGGLMPTELQPISNQLTIACPPHYPPTCDLEQPGTVWSSPVVSPSTMLRTGGIAAVHEQQFPYTQLQPIQKPGKKSRGKFKDDKIREETAFTRKIGSCIRCRVQKIRCVAADDGSCCQTCKNAKPNTPLWRIPCLRYKVSDCELFKPSGGVCGLKWTTRWCGTVKNINTWAGDEVRVIYLSDGYTRHGVPVKVRQFVPLKDDKLTRTWVTDGMKKSVDIPAWAICDINEAEQKYHQYLSNGFKECLDNVLKGRDPMLRETYEMALSLMTDDSQTMGNRNLLMKTMKLWMSIRLTTISISIVGEETLGMPQDIIDDEAAPMYGKIPVPPVLGAQVDMILIENVQMKLRDEILKTFNSMVNKNDKKSWLILYLVTFILLHNVAMITAHDASYATKHGLGRRYAREHKVKEYHLGAKILLAHFHYCCRGRSPFDKASKEADLKAIANLSDRQILFMHRTRVLIGAKTAAWEAVRERQEYEDDFFFVSQMYMKNWSPIETQVEWRE